MRIFVASYSIPKPDISSGDRRLFEMLCLLARRHKVHLWTCEPEPRPNTTERRRYQADLEAVGIKVIAHPAPLDETLVQAIYDAGIFEFYWVAEKALPLFRRIQAHAIVIIDSVDVAFAREESALALGVGSAANAAKTKRREMAMYRAADAVIAVSEADRDLLLAEEGTLQTGIVRNILRVRDDRKDPATKQLIFVGAFSWPPNVDGVLWFVRDIWPLIRRQEPGAVINIVGSSPTDDIIHLETNPGVVVHGFVPETQPYLDHADISVAPLRYGGGMKGKINEAMASGLPVVTTSIGSQGLNVRNGEHLYVADQPETFASCVVNLLRDPVARVRMGKAARDYTAGLCSPELAEQNLNRLLLETSKSRHRPQMPFARVKYVVLVNLKKCIRHALPETWLQQIREVLR